MSDQNITPNVVTPNDDDTPKKSKRTNTRNVTVSSMAKEYAKKHKVSESDAAKRVRGKLRANFDTVSKLDPSIKRAKTAYNDGNRWPTMNAKVRAFILDGKKK